MRRLNVVEEWRSSKLPNKPQVMLLKSDYRKLLRVAKAAEAVMNTEDDGYTSAGFYTLQHLLYEAVNALNAKPKP